MAQTISKITNISKAHLNNIMQIMVFELNDGNYYGINVSKIKSIEDYKRYTIAKNDISTQNDSHIIEGHYRYQNRVIPALNVEKWLKIYKEETIYKVIIFSEFNKKTIAFPIKDILNIYNIPTNELQTSHMNRDVITYSAIISIDGEKQVCYILDVEKLINDIFFDIDMLNDKPPIEFETDKKILIAEDSKSARAIVEEMLKDTGISYELFEDGEQLINELKKINSIEESGKIGLIITDLEMPHADGYQVLNYIKNNNFTKQIPTVVNSSMSNQGVKVKTKNLGAVGFIEKTDPKSFMTEINKNMRR